MLTFSHKLKTIQVGDKKFLVAVQAKNAVSLEATQQLDNDSIEEISENENNDKINNEYYDGKNIQLEELSLSEEEQKELIKVKQEQKQQNEPQENIHCKMNRQVDFDEDFQKVLDQKQENIELIKPHEPEHHQNQPIKKNEDNKQEQEQIQEENKIEEKIEEQEEFIPKTNFTHFISIPIDDSKSFQKKLKIFFEKIKDIDPDLEHFFYTKKSHFTLIMLYIEPGSEEVFIMILNELQQQLRKIARQDIVIKKKCYKFDLQGIDFFGERGKKASEARVVYTEMKDEAVIEKFNQYTDFLMQNLISMQMVDPTVQRNVYLDTKKQQYRVKKLHLTLMKKKIYQNANMDVRTVLKLLSKFIFGTISYSYISLNKLDENMTELCRLSLVQQI